MRIILTQCIDIDGDRWPHNWRKEYDSPIIPSVGMKIEDSLWKDPGEYDVLEVTINYEENYCYVVLEKHNQTISPERKDEIAHVAGLHGWSCSWTQYKNPNEV